jgi:hypothetical protein
MPTILKTKNSVTTTVAPTTLQQGELAVNITDKKMWVGNAATTPVQLFGAGADTTFTNISVSGVASFADGTVSLPSITNIGDTNTGIFFPAADTIAFTEGGTESMRIDANGGVGIGIAGAQTRFQVVASGASSFEVARLGNSQANSSGVGVKLGFQPNNDFVSNGLIGASVSAVSDGAPNNISLVFGTGAGGSESERMRITSTGLVGINTTAPLSRAQINGNIGSYATNGSDGAQLYIGGSGFDNGSYYNSAPGIGAVLDSNTSTAGALALYVYTGAANSRTRALNLNANGNVALMGATVTTSGTGITFPATQSASSDANTLDDYEEGTWTPVDASGASLSFSGAAGTYVKIGLQVTAWGYFIYPSTANGNNSQIGGLPFTSASPAQTRGGGMIGYSSESTFARILGPSGATTVTPYTAGGARITNATFSGDELYICVTYFL